MVILWLDIESGSDLVTSNLDGFSDHLTSILDGFGNHLDSILDACPSHLASILDAPMGDCRNSFLCAFVLFLAGFLLRSSVFGESRSFLFCVFVKNLDPVAGHRIQIFRPVQIFVWEVCQNIITKWTCQFMDLTDKAMIVVSSLGF